MSDDNAHTTRLILVHGTRFFQRATKPKVVVSEESTTTGAADDKGRAQARWFEPGSEFRDQLASNLRDSNIRFTTRILMWDGRNSIVSRNEAAVTLADEIGKLAKPAPDDPIVIIAHSHGGNVALRAVHIAGPESVANLKVVTLATPFLQIYTQTSFWAERINAPLEIDYSSPLGKEASAFLLICVAAVLGVAAAAPFTVALLIYQDAIRALLQPITFIDPPIAAFIATVILAIFAGGKLALLAQKLVVNPQATYAGAWGRDEGGPDGWAYRPDRLANLSFYAPPQTRKDWLLVLRGVDDEASLTLAAGSIGNRITHFILDRLLPNIFQLLALLATLMVGAGLAGWTKQSAAGMIALGYGAVAFLATTILALPGLFRLVFGRELLLGTWRCEIAANSSPDSGNGVQVKTLLMRPELAKRKLRHALYMNPDVPSCIVQWLLGKPSDATSGRLDDRGNQS
jgi:hypothetical protein